MEGGSSDNNQLIIKAKKILFKRNVVLLSILFLAPLVGVTDFLFKSNKVTLAVAILAFLCLGWQVIVLTFSRCPRCGKLFFCSKLWANGFTSKCMNCGLGVSKRKE